MSDFDEIDLASLWPGAPRTRLRGLWQVRSGDAPADDDGVKRGVVAHGQGRWQCVEGDGGPLCGQCRVCREGQCLLLLNI